MTAIIILGGIYFLFKIIGAICQSVSGSVSKSIKAERTKREQFQQNQEAWNIQQEQRMEALREAEQRQAMLQQKRWEEQARADAKRDAQLAKHEEQISKLQFQVSKATADIQFLNHQISQLYALLDIAQADQAGAVPGSKSDIKYQKQIIALTGRIHSMEQKLNKAKYDRDAASRKLAA